MKVLRAYKTELDPTNRQRTRFVQCCGAARFCYNWGLAAMIAARQEGRKTSVLAEKKRLNAIKREEYPWLYEVPYTVLESAFDNLKAAYENFFRRVKAGQTPGFPRFKSRKRGLGAFTLRGSLHAGSGRIKLPVIGWVRLKEHGYLPTEGGRIMSFTISERAHRWFVSALYEEECEEPEPATGKPIGVDFGIKELATCSDGTVFPNPRALESATRQVKRLSRELARRKKGGRNWAKTKAKLAKAHYRAACVRQHTLHQISHHLTAKSKPRTVVIEDLNVKGMLANHHLARAIADVAFGELRRQIEYKAAWHGVEVYAASQWFPSSKTCSECGAVREDLTLADRTFICPECGVMIDRDLNAALNLVALVA
jgi:putative transposase